MSHFLGFIIALSLLKGATLFLGTETSFFFEEVAFLIVFGGTACAALITFPVPELAKMGKSLVRILRKVPDEKKSTVVRLIQLSKKAQHSDAALLAAMEDPRINLFLKDGLELIISGFSKSDLETIMSERLFRDRERDESYGLLLRTLSKYPPAFGLVGTVLGLVTVMREVSGGAEASQVGMQMAIALIATFYGLLLTNFVLLPISENLLHKAADNMSHKELILEGLILIQEKRSPVYVQEVLNSYLSPLNRKDLIGMNQFKDKAS